MLFQIVMTIPGEFRQKCYLMFEMWTEGIILHVWAQENAKHSQNPW